MPHNTHFQARQSFFFLFHSLQIRCDGRLQYEAKFGIVAIFPISTDLSRVKASDFTHHQNERAIFHKGNQFKKLKNQFNEIEIGTVIRFSFEWSNQ